MRVQNGSISVQILRCNHVFTASVEEEDMILFPFRRYDQQAVFTVLSDRIIEKNQIGRISVGSTVVVDAGFQIIKEIPGGKRQNRNNRHKTNSEMRIYLGLYHVPFTILMDFINSKR